MKSCPKCYIKHNDSVLICDCGYHFKSEENYSTEIYSETKLSKNVNLNHYLPSGKFTSLTVPIYFILAIFSIILSIIVIIIAQYLGFLLSNSISEDFERFKVFIYYFVYSLGFAISGYILLIINIGTTLTKNRNKFILITFYVFAALAIFLIPLIFYNFILEKILDNVKSIELSFNQILLSILIDFIVYIFIISSNQILIGTVKQISKNPFCEKCQKYMLQNIYSFNESLTSNIIDDLKDIKNNNFKKFGKTKNLILTNDFPYIELIKNECENCHDGYVKLNQHYIGLSDEDGKNIKKNNEIYSESFNNEAMFKINNILNLPLKTDNSSKAK